MVYWGCGTARNRCVWTVGAAVSLIGIVLLCTGAGRMWVCNHTPSGQWLPQELVTCRVQAGILIALCPLVVILGVLPSLLFFQSCYAVRPPPVDWEKGVPDSGITVVRRTSNGAAVYRYDAHGRLLQAPDCYRQHTTPSPQSPSQAQFYHDSKWSSRGRDDLPGSPPAAAHSIPGGKCNKGSSGGGGFCSSSSSSGDKGGVGAGNRPERLLLSSNGGLNEESATAEVFVTLSPRRPGPPQASGGQDKK